MGIIAFIILGLLAGIIAKALLPGSDPGGLFLSLEAEAARQRIRRRPVGTFGTLFGRAP